MQEEYKKYLNFFKNYRTEILVFICFVVIVGVFYGNTLRNGFIHDDHGQIEQNFYIKTFKYLPRVLTGCIWEAALGDCKVSSYYRPLQSLSYLLTYQVSSGPWFFHLVNLVYYLIAIFAGFILVRLLTNIFFVAFISALIFAVHPLNTETVNWLATVPELTYTIFVILATIFWFKYRLEPPPDKKKSKDFWYHSTNLYLAYLFYALGVLAKEPAVFLPFVLLTLDLTYFKRKLSDYFNLKNALPYLVFVGIFTVYMGIRFTVLGGLGAGLFYSVTTTQKIYVFFDLLGDYVKKLFYPHPLNLFYEFAPAYQFWSIHFAEALLIAFTFVTLIIYSFYKKEGALAFSLVWFFVFLSPALIFINSLGENVFSERYAFASTFGFGIFVAWILDKIWQKNKFLKIIPLGFVTIILVASFFTVFARNLLWQNDQIIYADTLTKNPNADLIRYNQAVDLRDRGALAQAKDLFQTVADRGSWREVFKAYNNLGDIYRRQKNFDLAIQYFEKAIFINNNHKEAFNNIGAIFYEKGSLLKSLTYFCKALKIDPEFKDAKNNFDRVAGMVDSVDDTNFIFLYQDILYGGTFIKSSSTNKISYKTQDCSNPQGCLYKFTAGFDKNEFIFPFLIVGHTETGEAIKIRRTSFNPQNGEISLGVDNKFKNNIIDFLFPTCDGIYYEGNTRSVEAQKHEGNEPHEFGTSSENFF